jgi:hypothetical protein
MGPTGGEGAKPLHQRESEATTRSYTFLYVSSILGWLVVLVVAYVATHAGDGGRHVSGEAFLAAAVVWTALEVGWLLFLRGLHRRDLSRIKGAPPRSYDPRSR